MALIFSVAMLSVPYADIMKANQPLAHGLRSREPTRPFLAAFAARYGGLVLTLLGALFLVAVRLAGNTVASIAEHSFGLFSKKLGTAAGEKIRAFHAGLDTMRTFSEFSVIAALSIACGCSSPLPTSRAVTPSRQVRSWLQSRLPNACSSWLPVAEPASSNFPVLGWFTQIGIVAAAITGLFGANAEAATACAAVLLLTTFLGIVPVGLIWAQLDHVSLRKVTVESEHAE